MKKTLGDAPRRKYTKLRWISVDNSETFSFQTSLSLPLPNETSKTSNKDLEKVLLEASTLAELPSVDIKSSKTSISTSLVPKSTRFLKKDPSIRSYCPYYIKPSQWSKISNAPEYDGDFENKRIKNFYYHMHEESPNPNPFIQKSESIPAVKIYEERLSSLPPIQKYKQ